LKRFGLKEEADAALEKVRVAKISADNGTIRYTVDECRVSGGKVICTGEETYLGQGTYKISMSLSEVLFDIGLFLPMSPGKTGLLLPVIGLSAWTTSTAWRESGTICGVSIFMRSAGISQRALSMSNSGHSASISSDVLTLVYASSHIANLLTAVPT
jgi:hypothetical protein